MSLSGPAAVSVQEAQTPSARYTATGGASVSVVQTGDGVFFTLNASGDLTPRNPLDFDPRPDANGDNVYEITVEARLPGQTTAAQTLAVRVTVTNDPADDVVKVDGARAGEIWGFTGGMRFINVGVAGSERLALGLGKPLPTGSFLAGAIVNFSAVAGEGDRRVTIDTAARLLSAAPPASGASVAYRVTGGPFEPSREDLMFITQVVSFAPGTPTPSPSPNSLWAVFTDRLPAGTADVSLDDPALAGVLQKRLNSADVSSLSDIADADGDGRGDYLRSPLSFFPGSEFRSDEASLDSLFTISTQRGVLIPTLGGVPLRVRAPVWGPSVDGDPISDAFVTYDPGDTLLDALVVFGGPQLFRPGGQVSLTSLTVTERALIDFTDLRFVDATFVGIEDFSGDGVEDVLFAANYLNASNQVTSSELFVISGAALVAAPDGVLSISANDSSIARMTLDIAGNTSSVFVSLIGDVDGGGERDIAIRTTTAGLILRGERLPNAGTTTLSSLAATDLLRIDVDTVIQPLVAALDDRLIAFAVAEDRPAGSASVFDAQGSVFFIPAARLRQQLDAGAPLNLRAIQ